MIGGKPFDVESLLRDCVVKKKRPIHDAVQIYDHQQQQATDLSIGKEKIQSGMFKHSIFFFFLINLIHR